IDAALVTHLDTFGNIQTSFSNDGTSVFAIPTAHDVSTLTADGTKVLFARQRGGLIVVTRTTDTGGFLGDQDNIVSFASAEVLGGISTDALGDIDLVTDTPVSFLQATLFEFDAEGDQIGTIKLNAPGGGDQATAVAGSDGGKVLVGFAPYAIGRVA